MKEKYFKTGHDFFHTFSYWSFTSCQWTLHRMIIFCLRFEGFTAMKFHVVVIWIVTSCIDVVEYQSFGGPCYLHLQVVTPCSDVVGQQSFGGSCCLHLQVVTPCSYVSHHITTWCRNVKTVTWTHSTSALRNKLTKYLYLFCNDPCASPFLRSIGKPGDVSNVPRYCLNSRHFNQTF
jgi:hypothetical protein